jgi:hypothetical protein
VPNDSPAPEEASSHDDEQIDYIPSKHEKMNILKHKITLYLETNDNIYKTCSEWQKITGLCGYKGPPQYHYAIVTTLCKHNFLEQKRVGQGKIRGRLLFKVKQ